MRPSGTAFPQSSQREIQNISVEPDEPMSSRTFSLATVALEVKSVAFRKNIEEQQDFMSSAVASQYLKTVETSHKASGEIRPYLVSLVERIESTMISKIDQEVLQHFQTTMQKSERTGQWHGLMSLAGIGMIGLGASLSIWALASNATAKGLGSTLLTLGLGFTSIAAGIATVRSHHTKALNDLTDSLVLHGALNIYTGVVHRLLDDLMADLVALVKQRGELSPNQQRPRFQEALLHSLSLHPSQSQTSFEEKVLGTLDKDFSALSRCQKTNRYLIKYLKVCLESLPVLFREGVSSLEKEVPKQIKQEYDLTFEKYKKPKNVSSGEKNELNTASGSCVSGLSYDEVESTGRECLRARVATPVKRKWLLGAPEVAPVPRRKVASAVFSSFRPIAEGDRLPESMSSHQMAAQFLLSASEHPQQLYRSKDVLESPFLVQNILMPKKDSDGILEAAILDILQQSTYLLGTKNLGNCGIKRLPKLESSSVNFTHKIKFVSSQLSSKRMKVRFEPLGMNHAQQPLVTMVCDNLKSHDRL